MTLKLRFMVPVAMVIATAISAPAKADQIDGNWCRGLKHLFIDGPDIVTPGGSKTQGDYDRHGFRYVVPDGEPDAGASVKMVQVHDDLMQLSSSATSGEVEDWTRCQRQIS